MFGTACRSLAWFVCVCGACIFAVPVAGSGDPTSSIPRVMHIISRNCAKAPYLEQWWKMGWAVRCYSDLLPHLEQQYPERASLFRDPRTLSVQLSDLLRLVVVFQNGGGYADDDVEPYPFLNSNFVRFQDSELIVGWERKTAKEDAPIEDMLNKSLGQWQFFAKAGSPTLNATIWDVITNLEQLHRSETHDSDIRSQVIGVSGPSAFTKRVRKIRRAQKAQERRKTLQVNTTGVASLAQTTSGTAVSAWRGLMKSLFTDAVLDSSRSSANVTVLTIHAFGCGQGHSQSPPCEITNPRIWSKHWFQASWLGGQPVAIEKRQDDDDDDDDGEVPADSDVMADARVGMPQDPSRMPLMG